MSAPEWPQRNPDRDGRSERSNRSTGHTAPFAGHLSAPAPRDPWHFIRKYPNECCAEVTRKGELEPCDATAIAAAVDDEDGSYWPVCARHASRYHRQLVPLTDVLAFGGAR